LDNHKKTRILLLHGQQLDESGQMTDEFKLRLEKLRDYISSRDILIIMGGVTRAGFASEAEMAEGYIQANYVYKPRIILEDRSTTTGENLMFAQEILKRLEEEEGVVPSHIVAFHRRSAVESKLPTLYRKLMPGQAVQFIRCPDLSSWQYKLIEFTAMRFLAWFDPREESFIWKWFKRKSRNFQD